MSIAAVKTFFSKSTEEFPHEKFSAWLFFSQNCENFSIIPPVYNQEHALANQLETQSVVRLSASSSIIERRIAAALAELGLDSLDIRVFLFLFGKRLEPINPGLSSYEIYNKLRIARTASLPLFQVREKITEKNVSECLGELVAYGFVSHVKPEKKRGARSGRRPKWLYSAVGVEDIKKSLLARVAQKREAVIEAIDRLGEAEEAVGLTSKKNEQKEVGEK
jgi:hypothetical protein